MTDYLKMIDTVTKAGAVICVASSVSIGIASATGNASDVWVVGSAMALVVGVSMVRAADKAFKDYMSRGTVILRRTFS